MCCTHTSPKKIGSSGNVTGKKKKQQGIQNFISQVSTTKQPKLDEFRPPTSSEKRERDVETALRCIKLQSIKSACDDPTITLSYEDKFIQMPAADPKKICQVVIQSTKKMRDNLVREFNKYLNIGTDAVTIYRVVFE